MLPKNNNGLNEHEKTKGSKLAHLRFQQEVTKKVKVKIFPHDRKNDYTNIV